MLLERCVSSHLSRNPVLTADAILVIRVRYVTTTNFGFSFLCRPWQRFVYHCLFLKSGTMRPFLLYLAIALSNARAFISLRVTNRLTTSQIFHSSPNTDDDASWMQSLRARQTTLLDQAAQLQKRWRNPQNCESSIVFAANDWIRQISIDWPILACGTASSQVICANLNTGQLLCSSRVGVNTNSSTVDNDDYTVHDPELSNALAYLRGAHDGGGTLAVAVRNGLVVDARRSRGVHLHRLSKRSFDYLGTALPKALVTSLKFSSNADNDYLWVGTADGSVLAMSVHETEPILRQQLEFNVKSTVTSLSVNDDLDCVVATTACGSGTVYVIDLQEEQMYSFSPPFDNRKRSTRHTVCLCAEIVKHSHKHNNEDSYSVVCGANDGSLWAQQLHLDKNGCLQSDSPWKDSIVAIQPSHFGPVQSLTSPQPGLFATVGQDGKMRMWDLQERKLLFQYIGYKVWIGSLWTDGRRLISDGADNTVVMHDFSIKEEETSGKGER
jgi:WD40 repeat protein